MGTTTPPSHQTKPPHTPSRPVTTFTNFASPKAYLHASEEHHNSAVVSVKSSKNESPNPQLPDLRGESLQIDIHLLPSAPQRLRIGIRQYRAEPTASEECAAEDRLECAGYHCCRARIPNPPPIPTNTRSSRVRPKALLRTTHAPP